VHFSDFNARVEMWRCTLLLTLAFWYALVAHAAASSDLFSEKRFLNPYENGGRRLQTCTGSPGDWQCGTGSCAGCCPSRCSSCTCSTCTNCASASSSGSGGGGGSAVAGILIPLSILLLCFAYVQLRRRCFPQAVAPDAPGGAPPYAAPPPHLHLAAPAPYPHAVYPDPALHHRVSFLVTQGGPLGAQLVPAPGGAGVVVHGVAPGALAGSIFPGDRLFSVGGVDALALPPGSAIALLQRAPRPLQLEFLRRNAPGGAAAPHAGADDPTPPTIVKEAAFAFAAPAAPPPDPALHHAVGCSITRAGLVGLGLAPAPGGAGVVVERVAPDTAVAPPPQAGDRVLSINGADMLMAPFPAVIAALQSSPRPAPITFLRRHAALPAPAQLTF
jgi:hypothetical protein